MVDTQIARQLLAELELVSHGTTQAWNPSGGGHNAERPAFPPGEPKPPHIALRARLNAALTQTQVDRVCTAAREALRAAKYTPPPTGMEPPYGTVQWKRWIAASSETNAELARRFNVSAQYIGQVRKDWGPDTAAA